MQVTLGGWPVGEGGMAWMLDRVQGWKSHLRKAPWRAWFVTMITVITWSLLNAEYYLKFLQISFYSHSNSEIGTTPSPFYR